ncbi:MAG: biotin/lipoyl-binding protein, partial [Desulfobacterales bacterium]|nr:biotin/lipoyl-binding protein [Desulfobacterales bacterium]
MNRNARHGLNAVNAEEEMPLKTSTKPVLLIAFLVLILGFGTFLGWAFWAPLDEGVVAPGVVTVASYRKTIQHQHGGTVQEILVKEGDRVKKEQLLVRLNDAQ